jgi:hypothetical protein
MRQLVSKAGFGGPRCSTSRVCCFFVCFMVRAAIKVWLFGAEKLSSEISHSSLEKAWHEPARHKDGSVFAVDA